MLQSFYLQLRRTPGGPIIDEKEDGDQNRKWGERCSQVVDEVRIEDACTNLVRRSRLAEWAGKSRQSLSPRIGRMAIA